MKVKFVRMLDGKEADTIKKEFKNSKEYWKFWNEFKNEHDKGNNDYWIVE